MIFLFGLPEYLCLLELPPSDYRGRIGLMRAYYSLQMKNSLRLQLYTAPLLEVMPLAGVFSPDFKYAIGLWNLGAKGSYDLARFRVGVFFFWATLSGEDKIKQLISEQLSQYDVELESAAVKLTVFKFGLSMTRPVGPVNVAANLGGCCTTPGNSFYFGVGVLKKVSVFTVGLDILYDTYSAFRAGGIIAVEYKNFGLNLGASLPGLYFNVFGQTISVPVIPKFDIYFVF